VPGSLRSSAQDLLRARLVVRTAFSRANLGDLSPTAAAMLVCLYAEGPQSPTELAERLLLDRGSVGHALSDLEAQGLLAQTSVGAGGHRRRELKPQGHRRAVALIERMRRALA
jgi:DNA-binding MarR family transcriptional regulator